MAQFLRSSDPGFAGQFKALVESRRDTPLDMQDTVRAIVGAVREKGDAALIEFTARFDRTDLGKTGLRIPVEELKRAYEGLAPELRGALVLACERIEKHHRRQLPQDERYVDAIGAELGHRWTPLELGRPLCAGRKGELSKLGVDERHPGEGCGRGAPRDGRANAGWGG